MANRSATLCCHCGDGVPYDRYYFTCLFCDLAVCKTCYERHPRAHLSWLKQTLDRSTSSGSTPDEADCANCMKIVHERLQCSECSLATCGDCYKNTRDNWQAHEHRRLHWYRAPDNFCLDKNATSCQECTIGRSLIHCNRCSKGVGDGETVTECITCLKDYGGCTVLCSGCLVAGKASHDPSHRFVSFTYKHTPLNSNKDHFNCRCLECFEDVELNTSNLAQHAHGRYLITMGSLENDRLIQRAYRECVRKPVQNLLNDEDMHGEFGCACCYGRFAKNARLYQCTVCELTSCANCYIKGPAQSHPHPMLCADLEMREPPADLYKRIQETTRYCDQCKDEFNEFSASHLRCRRCVDYDICQKCISSGNIAVQHGCPASSLSFTYYDPKPMPDEWWEEQVRLRQALLDEEEQLKAESAARAAAQARQAPAPTAQRPVQRAPAPRVTPAPARPTAASARPRTQMPKGTKTALFKSGLKLGVAVLKVANAANGGGGGSGGGFTGTTSDTTSSFDMGSFWAPINSAASDPIQ